MSKKTHLSSATRIVTVYVAMGALWILLSDRLLGMVVPEPERITWIQTLKGWGFIVATGIVLYMLLSRFILRLESVRDKLKQQIEEKTADLSRTVEILHGEVLRAQRRKRLNDSNSGFCKF